MNDNPDRPDDTPDHDRRRVLAGLAASSLALGGAGPAAARALAQNDLPAPEHCGIDHFVVVMMENRSFDHFLGWVPGADGQQVGLNFADAAGTVHATRDLAPDFQNCSSADPDHSYDGGPHACRRRRDERLPADAAGRRHVPDRLLHRRKPAVLCRLRLGLDDLRPLLLGHPVVHVPEPHVHACGPDRPHHEQLQHLHPADHLGQPEGSRRIAPLLLQRRARHGTLGQGAPRHQPQVRALPAGRRGRAPAGGELHRSSDAGRGQRRREG